MTIKAAWLLKPNCQRNEFKYAILYITALNSFKWLCKQAGKTHQRGHKLQKELERDLEASEYNIAAKVVDANGKAGFR